MKKFIILIGLIVICIFVPVTHCDASFAQIVNSGTNLYANPENSSDIKNIICVMENTYYVEILHTYNEDFYKVNYNGVTGFVNRRNVKKVDGTPTTPYPDNIKMKTINNNVYLRSTPTKGNNTLSIIPANCTNLKFIGYAYGEQVDDFRENVWYYVNYLDVYGYVYSEYISEISNIPQNIEKLNFISDDYVDITNPLSDASCIIVICVLLTPTLLILLLLYKKPKQNKKFKTHVVVINEYDDKL